MKFLKIDLKLIPIVWGPKCWTRKLSQLIDKVLKTFLKHIKSLICKNLNFLIKFPSDLGEDTKPSWHLTAQS